MKCALLFLFVLLAAAAASTVGAASIETLTYESFGTIYVYPPDSGTTNTVAIIVSGDGGWRGSELKMADMLATQNTLVVGFDIRHYIHQVAQRHESCTDTVADFVRLSNFLKAHYKISADMKPLLLGYSSGATLVYGVLVQAPADTFLGGISFGFCPDLQLNKPLCSVESVTLNPNRLSFLPAKNLQTRWYAFQGMTDQVCNEEETREYVEKVPNSKFILLPMVGHGFRKPRGWIEEFCDAYKELTHQDLHLHEITTPFNTSH
jgi:Type IV secretory pathway, VirJ component